MNYFSFHILILLILVIDKTRQDTPNAQCLPNLETKSGCPGGWIPSDDTCYLLIQNPLKNLNNAAQDCSSYGGVLLRIETLEQHYFISQELDILAVDKSIRWYTAGSIDPANFPEFIWERSQEKLVRPDLMSIWIDKPPNAIDKPTWNPERTRIVYGFNNIRWGWYIDNSTNLYGYVCQASKDNAEYLKSLTRTISYGQLDMSNVQFGPCFIIQPTNQWFIKYTITSQFFNQQDQKTSVRFECLALGNPPPKYRWYRIGFSTPENSQNAISQMIRTEINPSTMNDKRYAIVGGQLSIYNPEGSKDSDQFQCEAYNDYGSVLTRTAMIVFAGIDEFEKQDRSAVFVQAYTSTTLPCDPPNHYPEGSLNYAFLMSNIHKPELNPVRSEFRSGVFVSLANGLLGFSEVTKQDEGDYVCMVSLQTPNDENRQSVKSPNIPLRVGESNEPRKETRIHDMFPAVWPSKPMKGNIARIECFASGDIRRGPLIYDWKRKDGKPIDSNKIVDFGRVIQIENVQPVDQGIYICSVTDALGLKAQPKETELKIYDVPYFLKPVNDVIVDIGGNVTLTCYASGIPTPTHIWYKGSENVSSLIADRTLDPTRYMLSDGTSSAATLTISKLTKADSGMFTCLASNSQGSSASSGELKVLQLSPSFDKFPVLPVEAMVGYTAVMSCQPEAAPVATTNWFKDGAAITPGATTIDSDSGKTTCLSAYCSLPSGNLFINNIALSSAGVYECRAVNSLGEARSSALLTVVNTLIPSLTPQNRVVNLNTTVMIPCRALINGHLDVNYAWYYQGVQIKFDRLDLDARRYELSKFFRPFNRYFGTLQITNIQYENEGVYACEIQTALASQKNSGTILISGPPGPCAGVEALASNSTQLVDVFWTKGASHTGPILWYRIEAKAEGDVWREVLSMVSESPAITILTTTNEDRGRRKVTITSFGANIQYYIRVFAANAHGLGPASPASKSITTAPMPPTKSAKNVTGGGGKYQTLVVRWEPLLKKDENGNGFFYRIKYRAKGTQEFTKINVQGADLKFFDDGKYVQYTIILNQESFYEPYEVAVQAINNVGEGPVTDVSLIMSAARVPRNAPKDIIAGAENSTSINVWWNKPEITPGIGPILGYRIIYYPRNNTDCRSIDSLQSRYTLGERQTINGDVNTGRVIGLDPDTYYCLVVQMFNSAGDGPDSSTTEQTTFKKAPTDFPTFVQLNATDYPSTLKVSWAGVQSKYDEESIDGYTIRYWLAGANFKETLIDKDVGLTTTGYITNLTINTRYEVRIFAYSRGGVGTMSSPIVSFQLIERSRCVSGATWDGPDMRYLFICAGCNSMPSLFITTFIFITVNLLISLL